MVSVLVPAGVTGFVLKVAVEPAGLPVALSVTGLVKPRIEPMLAV
ncbi:MAG: hypothetical protein BWY91_02821 [bacterium ADurb.BinA028]|nr:MAG: hypothetical protein BWY91_02821 [bacterium ADurb.BinA028]